jgi:YbbR domain-containing protein
MRLPERDSDWQLIISSLMLVCSIFLVILAEAKNRQAEAMLKRVQTIEKTVKEVCQ